MEITLTPLQKQVDLQIDTRISRIMQAEYKKTNILPNGRRRKIIRPITPPQEVHDLLSLKQRLYNGESAEGISAEITGGQIQETYLKS